MCVYVRAVCVLCVCVCVCGCVDVWMSARKKEIIHYNGIASFYHTKLPITKLLLSYRQQTKCVL